MNFEKIAQEAFMDELEKIALTLGQVRATRPPSTLFMGGLVQPMFGRENVNSAMQRAGLSGSQVRSTAQPVAQTPVAVTKPAVATAQPVAAPAAQPVSVSKPAPQSAAAPVQAVAAKPSVAPIKPAAFQDQVYINANKRFGGMQGQQGGYKDLKGLIQARDSGAFKKGSDQYNQAQNTINQAYGKGPQRAVGSNTSSLAGAATNQQIRSSVGTPIQGASMNEMKKPAAVATSNQYTVVPRGVSMAQAMGGSPSAAPAPNMAAAKPVSTPAPTAKPAQSAPAKQATNWNLPANSPFNTVGKV